MSVKFQVSRRIRLHVERELYVDADTAPGGTAIYSLADPRHLRQIRYIGQTSQPRRRFLQHLNAARLWLPEERPWWIKSPKLRPLYTWIRELYADELRLPTMVICSWAETTKEARMQERRWIMEALAGRLPLLNVEAESLGEQIQLI